MKKIFTLVVALGLYCGMNAQAVESRTKYDKQEVAVAIIEIDADKALVEKVVEDDLKARGFGKGKSSKGFTQYAGINFNDISPEKIDFYINTDRKGKKDKGKTVVSLLVSKGYNNFVSGNSDPSIMSAMQNYLNSLLPKIDKAQFGVQVEEQEDALRKAEKKAGNLEDDLNDLEKKKRKIEDDIADKKKEIEKQKEEVAKLKAELEALKNRKKG